MYYHLVQDDNPDTLQFAMAVETAPGTVVMLMRLATAIKKRSTEELMGVKMRQMMLLSYLRHGAPAFQQQLCEALWLDANNCVLLLNELEDLGYIERRRDPADRRRHVVELTDEGRIALERAERAQETIGDELLSALSDEERGTLRSLLSRLVS